MPRKESHRSAGIPLTHAAITAAPGSRRVGTMPAEAFKPASFEAVSGDACGSSLSAVPLPAEVGISVRQLRERASTSGTVDSAAARIEADATTGAPPDRKRASLDADLTRRRWRSLIGRHPPKGLSHALMERILAWREQVAEGGDISSRSRAIFAAALASDKVESKNGGETLGPMTGEPRDPRRPQPRAPLRTGTALMREHAGVLHRVTATPEGFEWEGKVYASLSAAARAITGVRWNGHRFFALDRAARDADPRKGPTKVADAYHKAHRTKPSFGARGAT